MNTVSERYEIKQEGFDVIVYANTLNEAATKALNALESKVEGHDAPITITDRRARKGKPSAFTATLCTGAAHSNPFIDHCGVCMPFWGVVIRPKESNE
jgi:hypothetical protein